MSIRKSSVTVQLKLRDQKEYHTDSVEFSLHLFGFSELQVVEIFCLFTLFTQSVAPAMNHGMMLQHGLLILSPKNHAVTIHI